MDVDSLRKNGSLEMLAEKKQRIENIISDIYKKTSDSYTFEDFARDNRIYRIRDDDSGILEDVDGITIFINGGYAIVLNSKLSPDKRLRTLGHEIGHVVLNHVLNSELVTYDGSRRYNGIGETPENNEEANYFEELWYDRFSGSDWIDMENLRDFTIYKNRIQKFWYSEHWAAMAVKSIVGYLRQII